MNPLEIFGILLLTILFITLFLYPERGLIALWKKNKINREKVIVEDTLKHIYDCEYNSTDCTLNSISGYLAVSNNASSKILMKLEEAGLVKLDGAKINLTPEGRLYALRIIRTHRLWERYLADNTSIKESDWHNLAEHEEHNLTDEQVNQLAAKLGNPLKDPHGDPIPSEVGEIPHQIGKELFVVPEGEIVKVYHIEDQPPEIYSEIIRLGIFPGMYLKLIEKSAKIVKVISDGVEIYVPLRLAMNIHVTSLKADEEISEVNETLSNIEVGEEVTIVNISKAMRGQQRRRLLDLGIVPGTKIKARLRSIGGDPTAYDVRGTTIALRKNQADKIFIKR